MFTLGEHISPFVEKGSAENFPSKTTLRDFWPILKFFRVKVKFILKMKAKQINQVVHAYTLSKI